MFVGASKQTTDLKILPHWVRARFEIPGSATVDLLEESIKLWQ